MECNPLPSPLSSSSILIDVLQIVPQAHRGKKELIPMDKNTSLGSVFTFQRRKYIYDSNTDTFTKVRCKVDLPMSFFFQWRGFSSDTDVIDAQVQRGKRL